MSDQQLAHDQNKGLLRHNTTHKPISILCQIASEAVADDGQATRTLQLRLLCGPGLHNGEVVVPQLTHLYDEATGGAVGVGVFGVEG